MKGIKTSASCFDDNFLDCLFTLKSPFVKFLFIVLFYRKFRLCFTNTSGKAHTPKIRGVSIGSLREGAVAKRLRESALQ